MKNKGKETPDIRKWQDTVAGWLAKGIIAIRKKWADAMGRLMAGLSPRRLKVIWGIGTLLMAGYCCLLVVSAFRSKDAALFYAGDIHRPRTAINSNIKIAVPASRKALLPILRFRKYLDSLSLTEQGRKTKDSLLRLRPGLMDSLAVVERLYCQ